MKQVFSNKLLKSIAAGVSLCAVVAAVSPAAAGQSVRDLRQEFNIPEQSLSKALFSFSEATKIVVVASGEVLKGKTSGGLSF